MATFKDRLGEINVEKKRKQPTLADSNPLNIPTTPMTIEAKGEEDLSALALRDENIRNWAEEQQAKINERFTQEEKRLERKELIQTLSQAIAQFGAAMTGLRKGVDMSDLKFVKQDFEKKLDRLSGRRAQEEATLGREVGSRRRLAELLERERARKAERAEDIQRSEAARAESAGFREREMGLREQEAAERREQAKQATAAKMAAVEVQRRQAQLKADMSDPTSEASKRAQDAASRLSGRDFSGFSAADIKSVLPKLIDTPTTEKAKKLDLTEAEKAIDKSFSKEYVDHISGSSAADTKRSIRELEDVSKSLEEIDTATGAFIGLVPKAVRDIVTPRGAAMQDIVESVVQKSLRETLGAQFTEKEAERLIDRAYNPRLDEKENKRRVDNLIQQIKEAAKSKQEAVEYYEANGTLKGFKGQLFNISDFNPEKPAPEVRDEVEERFLRRLKGEQVEQPQDKIKVRRKSDGQLGLLPRSQFEANKDLFDKVK